MIKISCLDGPWAGRVRHMVDGVSAETGTPVDPGELFTSFLQHGWRWEVDYSEATEEETFSWLRNEMAVRIIRALQEGREVKFLGRKWRVQKNESVQDVAQDVEDAIVVSGRLISISRDDESGLVISTHGYEQ